MDTVGIEPTTSRNISTRCKASDATTDLHAQMLYMSPTTLY